MSVKAARSATAPRAHRVSGHFGEWLQGRYGSNGPLVLVTLPCNRLEARARFQTAQGLHLEQDEQAYLSDDMARRFLTVLGAPLEGLFEIDADMPPGGGAGSSTASLLALAAAAGVAASPEALAAACLSVEGAVDPLMLDDPDTVLWAPRTASTIARLGQVPSFDIIGGFLGPATRTEADDTDFPDIADLIGPWKTAVRREDRAKLAELASLSAERTTFYRGPADDPTAAMAERLGALGYLRAHTGSARGLIFAPGKVPNGAEAMLLDSGYDKVIRFRTADRS